MWCVMAGLGKKSERSVEFNHVDGFTSVKDLVSFLSSYCIGVEDIDGLNFGLSKGVEVTVKSVSKYNELMQKLMDVEEVEIIRSSEVYTVVTLHNVPFEFDLKILYAKMGEYGRVLDHVKCVHADFPSIYNGVYKFKMDLKSFPPSNFSFGRRNVMVNFPGQSRKCLKCGEGGHMIRDCKSDPKCRNCGEIGHRARDCSSEVVCSVCGVTGHKYEDCPKASSLAEMPVSLGGNWAKIAARKPKRGTYKKPGGTGSRRNQGRNTESNNNDDIGQPGPSGISGSGNTRNKPDNPPLQVSEPPNIEPNKNDSQLSSPPRLRSATQVSNV